jgi:hypothetical protein
MACLLAESLVCVSAALKAVLWVEMMAEWMAAMMDVRLADD